MDKVRWGVIGAAGIADRRTIPGMMLAGNAELVSVMEVNKIEVPVEDALNVQKVVNAAYASSDNNIFVSF